MKDKSLSKRLTALDTLAASPSPSPSPLSVARLRRQLKVTRPAIYRTLGTLAHHEYVTCDADGPFYRVSCLDAVAGVSHAMGAASVRPSPGPM